uniref:RRM domain-containing protein n=1 Tax=Trichobilharzia regenti TaxID=157069 RepID=A0AA85IV80_TRIRE
MAHPAKRSRYDVLAAATAQFYNTTGTVPASLQLATDISYLVTNQPSCTIVVADIPEGCTERDLIGLFSRFGQIKNAKLVCSGRAALVEFCEISPPTRLVHMAKINPFCVGPNRVRLEFSSEVITPVDRKHPHQSQSSTIDNSSPTRILHLDIANAEYPITVDVIKAICSPHGNILRTFIGKKNLDRSLEALVEFENVEEARAAKEQLDGADIYSGCCNLTVGYSRLQRVHVTQNDSESWDFTGPSGNVEGPLNNSSTQRTLLGPAAPVGGLTPAPSILPPPVPAAPLPVYPAQPYQQPQPPMGYYGMGPYTSPVCAVPPGAQFAAPAYPGYWPATMIPPAGVQPMRPLDTGFTTPSRIVILPTPPPVHQVNTNGVGIGHSTSNLSISTPATRQSDLSVFEAIEGVVLMVSNIPQRMNCDHLFNLFCLYGNVARIKFLKTRPGVALVQVGNPEAADLIHRYFNGVCVFGKNLQLHHSKITELKEHENLGTLSDGSPVMKNYMMDPNNRFRNSMVAAKSRILEPSRTLHFFNAPLNSTPEDICRIFTDSGAMAPPRVVIFTTKEGQKTSLGLVEWDTLTEALEALILANHRPIHLSGFTHPFHLKIAFSPKPISEDRAGISLIRYPAPPLTSTQYH